MRARVPACSPATQSAPSEKVRAAGPLLTGTVRHHPGGRRGPVARRSSRRCWPPRPSRRRARARSDHLRPGRWTRRPPSPGRSSVTVWESWLATQTPDMSAARAVGRSGNDTLCSDLARVGVERQDPAAVLIGHPESVVGVRQGRGDAADRDRLGDLPRFLVDADDRARLRAGDEDGPVAGRQRTGPTGDGEVGQDRSVLRVDQQRPCCRWIPTQMPALSATTAEGVDGQPRAVGPSGRGRLSPGQQLSGDLLGHLARAPSVVQGPMQSRKATIPPTEHDATVRVTHLWGRATVGSHTCVGLRPTLGTPGRRPGSWLRMRRLEREQRSRPVAHRARRRTSVEPTRSPPGHAPAGRSGTRASASAAMARSRKGWSRTSPSSSATSSGSTATGEVGVHPLLERVDVTPLQIVGRSSRERGTLDVGQRRTAPEIECLGEHRRRVRGITRARQPSPPGDELVEPADVHAQSSSSIR